jgi:hypothetical protein
MSCQAGISSGRSVRFGSGGTTSSLCRANVRSRSASQPSSPPRRSWDRAPTRREGEPAVPAARAASDITGFEEPDSHAGLGERERARAARHACADDDNPSCPRRRRCWSVFCLRQQHSLAGAASRAVPHTPLAAFMNVGRRTPTAPSDVNGPPGSDRRDRAEAQRRKPGLRLG